MPSSTVAPDRRVDFALVICAICRGTFGPRAGVSCVCILGQSGQCASEATNPHGHMFGPSLVLLCTNLLTAKRIRGDASAQYRYLTLRKLSLIVITSDVAPYSLSALAAASLP